jgi:YVTN family beta-propeller protein
VSDPPVGDRRATRGQAPSPPGRSGRPGIAPAGTPSDRLRLSLVEVIGGTIAPKSVVASQTGLFFAQNMMYYHTITVYDRTFRLVRTIHDGIELAEHGHAGYTGRVRGAPVEAAFTTDGDTAFVSQYSMYGPGFPRPGRDLCSPADDLDESFVYRIDVPSFSKAAAIRVGSTPKYLAVTPDDRLVLVSNWCSFDLSIVDAAANEQVARIPLGRWPRGIAIHPTSDTAYVALMGGRDIAKVDLGTLRVRWIRDVGSKPRHLVIDAEGRFLYATLDGDGAIIKIDVASEAIVGRVSTGRNPRTMVLAPDGRSLYVVNYGSDTVSKVRTADMTVLQELRTGHHPIGITYDDATRQVWVASYSGTIRVFQDR